MSSTEDQDQGPVIRDRRRIDPVTGKVRESAAPGSQRGQATSQSQPASPGPQRGPGGPGGPGSQPRPGRHSVSKPGGTTGSPGPAGAGSPASPSQAGTGTGVTDAAAGSADGADDGSRQIAEMLAERTADLQRLQAEYSNYRKRVERDRLAVREQALANVLSELLPVLDDIGRAREHGELSGGFKSVADSLESITGKLGLTSYGENGDPFDPTLHEALMHEYSAEVTEPSCVRILQPGYKVGDRIIRPARVAVAEPGGDAGPPDDAEPAPPASPASGDDGAGD
jgi:molecular chaperone GrpE